MINENDSAVLFQLTERWGIADYRKIAAEDLGMTGQGPLEAYEMQRPTSIYTNLLR